MAQDYSLSFLGPCHMNVQAGVCVFSLVLAWNSNTFSIDSVHCFYDSAVDQFGDHFLGCVYGPMRIHWRDALCDIVFYALLQNNSGCKRKQHCDSALDCPRDVYHPDFLYGKPVYFDATVHNYPYRILL